MRHRYLYWVELTAIKNVYKLTMEDFNFMWRMVQLTNGITIIETFKSIMIFLFNIDDRTVLFHISKWFLAWAIFGGTEVSFLRQKCPMGGQNCPFFFADDRSVLFTVFFGQECPFPKIFFLSENFFFRPEFFDFGQFNFFFPGKV